MTIKTKILIPVIILTVLVAAAILTANIIQFSNNVDSNLYASLNTATSAIQNQIDMLKSAANVASLYLADDSAIVRALESGDRETLLNRTTQLYTETGVGFCTIADAAGIALARPHKPESYGDDVTAMPSVQSALSGKNLTTIEPGSSVRMSICSGAPIFSEQGELLGIVVVGYRLDTEEFVDSIKQTLNCEVTVFLGDERISTTVKKDDGTRAVGTKAAENVSQTVLAGNDYSGAAQILNRDALTKYTPIRDADGKVLGMLFVGRYQNEKIDIILSFVQLGLLITVILLGVCIPVILISTRRITTPIKAMVQAAYSLAAGDTGISIQVKTKDETSELASAFNQMIENTQIQIRTIEEIASGDLTVKIMQRGEKDAMNFALKNMVENLNHMFHEINASAAQVSTGSKQIADGAQTLAQGSTEQASAIEELSASISEIVIKTKQNANIAREASGLSSIIKDNAEKGSLQMEHMMQAVKEINDASGQISNVIKVIDDIAFQTNILALNAAVEAARAGQHGKGFAVVAEEVRNLAAKSAEAAKDTGGLIENSIEKANLGLNIATETCASLKEIVEGINHSAEIVAQIARSSDEQAGAITQINTGIDQVAQVVQQNSATAEESAAASEEMSGQSDILEQLIAQFKLKNSDYQTSLIFSTASREDALAMPREAGFSLTGDNEAYEKY